MCWIVAALGYVVLEAAAANRAGPGYRYAHDYISTLGVPATSPLAGAMNAAFVMQGLLFFVGALLLAGPDRHRRRRPFVALVAFAATNAVGNALVAMVHSGSAGWAWLHALGAMFAIAGGNAAIVAGSAFLSECVGRQWYPGLSVALAAVGLLGLTVFLCVPSTGGYVGIFERASVYSILAWQTTSAVALLAVNRTRSAD